MFRGAHGFILVVLTLVSGMARAGAVDPRLPAAAPTRIVGRVIDAKTRAGIGSVQVRLDGITAAATTTSDGAFEFEDVAPGRHEVIVFVDGFAASDPVVVTVQPEVELHMEVEYSLQMTTEVRGTGSAAPASPPRVSLGPAELTGQQVASAIGGLGDVARVMQLRPGVAPSQDNRNDLLVRGGGAWETAVRVDGFELPTGSHFAWPGSSGGGISLIPSGSIQNASLDTGGFSVAFGERASGVMDVQTRSGARDAFGGRTELTAGGVYGLAEGRLPALDGQSGSWMVSARRSILEMAVSRGDSRAAPSYVDLVGNLDVPLSPVHRLHVLGFDSSDGLEVNWTLSSSALTGRETLRLGGVSLSSAWSDKTRTDVSVSWASNSTSLSEVQQTATSFLNASLERFLRVRGEIHRTITPHMIVVAGATLKRSDVNFNLQDGSFRNEWNIWVPAIKASWRDTVSDTAGYAEVNWLFGPAELTVGARADHSGRTDRWYASPRTHLEVRLGSRWRLTGGWGEYRQDIPDVWLGSNVANRSLDPVRCVTMTSGIEGAPWQGGSFTVEGFRKRYTGYPIDPSVPSRVLVSAGADFESPLVGILAPSGRVNADGVDTSFSQDFRGALTLALGYSYWDVREFNLLRQWIRADYDIRHQARVWLVWHKSRRWSASALWRYATGRPYTPYDVTASLIAGTGRFDRSKTNAVTYPAYHRLDLRAERVFTTRHSAVTLFVEVDNVYNRNNVYMYEWSKALRGVQPILQWGLTPIGGVRFDF
jgi:hypothetical protein